MEQEIVGVDLGPGRPGRQLGYCLDRVEAGSCGSTGRIARSRAGWIWRALPTETALVECAADGTLYSPGINIVQHNAVEG